jgi:hypothetical protein
VPLYGVSVAGRGGKNTRYPPSNTQEEGGATCPPPDITTVCLPRQTVPCLHPGQRRLSRNCTFLAPSTSPCNTFQQQKKEWRGRWNEQATGLLDKGVGASMSQALVEISLPDARLEQLILREMGAGEEGLLGRVDAWAGSGGQEILFSFPLPSFPSLERLPQRGGEEGQSPHQLAVRRGSLKSAGDSQGIKIVPGTPAKRVHGKGGGLAHATQGAG